MPSTSMVTSTTTRGSTVATPGIASIFGTSDNGARVSDANTSPNR